MKIWILAAAALAASVTMATAQSRGGYGSSGTYGTSSNPSSNSVEGYSGFVSLRWSQCCFATLPDGPPRGPIAQGDPGRSMRGLERAAKRLSRS
jgi:hypothetical protein